MNAALLTIIRAAATTTGDISGHCDNAFEDAQIGELEGAARELQLAEEQLQLAVQRVAEARAAITNAQGGAR